MNTPACKYGLSSSDFETFYPAQAGVADSNYQESGFTDGGDGDEDSTEYENEDSEIGGIEEAQLPTFRELVKAKKNELKSQYGKGHFSIGECGPPPVRLSYAPQVRIPKVTIPNCFWYDKPKDGKLPEWKCDGVKVVNPGVQNEEAYASADERFKADKAKWDQCRADNKGIWVSGWRKEWRKFKQAGGLGQLKQQAAGVGIPESVPVPPTQRPTGPVVNRAQENYRKWLAEKNAVEQSKQIIAKKIQEKDQTGKYIMYFIILLAVLIAIGAVIYVVRKK